MRSTEWPFAAGAALAMVFAPGVPLAIGGRPAGATERAAFTVVDDGALPRLDRVVIERLDDGGIRVEARTDGARSFAYEVGGGDAWPELADVTRYAVALEHGPPREFTDRRTGDVMLPRLPRQAWLPTAAPGAVWTDGWFDRGRLLGRELRRESGNAVPIPWEEPERVILDGDVLIATSRDFRDDGTGRHGDDWSWTPLSPADYARMIEAGFNLFRVRPRDLSWLIKQPVFLVASEGLGVHAGLPLLPTYRGAVMYVDEPAVRARRDDAFRSIGSPAEAAGNVAARTARTLRGSDRYGRGFLRASLDKQLVKWGGDAGGTYPVWEAVGSAAWYELEAGAGGWCFEARLNPSKFARDVESVTGVPFPESAPACVDLHLALFRGAARRFDKPWGVAAYGQADSATVDVLFPAAYDAGASYFWFWTSDRNHHVPHARQLGLATRLTEYAAAHPRGDGARARSRSAEVALVLPWGYTFDDDTFARRGLWGSRGLGFDDLNDAGVPHRQVLAAAVREAVTMIARGDSWDVLFLRDDEFAHGYREVHRVSADGRVRVAFP